MVKILQPHCVTYATVSSPSVVTTLLSSVTICNMFPGIVLKIAYPETIHKSGFSIVIYNIYIYIYIYIYLVGCVLFTSLHGAPIHSYFVEAEDKVTTLQSGYSVCTVKLWRDVALSLVSTKRRQ